MKCQMEMYYLENMDKFIEQFTTFYKKYIYHLLIKKYSEDVVNNSFKKYIDHFRDLLTRIPYIGGDKNPLTKNLIQSAWYLTLYKVMIESNIPEEEIGKLVYEIYEYYIESSWIRKINLKIQGKIMFMKFNIKDIKRHAKASNGVENKYDFIVKFVKGNGEEYDFGLDTFQCPIYYFFKQENASSFTRHICDLDFLRSKYLYSGLQRKGTLPEGFEKCDFRWKKGMQPIFKKVESK